MESNMLYGIKRDCKYIRYYDGDTTGHCFGQKNAPRCDFRLCTDRKCGFKCSGNYTIEESNTDQEIVDNKEFMSKVNINISNFKFGEWVSVEDRLPKEWESVLAWSECGFHTVAVYLGVADKWRECWTHTMLEGSITHWMPLPQPPKGAVND